MPRPLFSIDIQDDLIVGVLLQKKRKTITIAGCGATLIGSRSTDEAVVEVMEQAGFHGGTCRISLPAEYFFFRNLSLPFTDKKKINKILPFELEEKAPLEIDKLIVDAILAISEGKKSEVVAALLSRDILAGRLSALLSLELDPEIIAVSGVETAARLIDSPGCPADFIFLDIGLQRATMVVAINRGIVLIRSLGFDDGGYRADFQFGDNLTEIIPQISEDLAGICKVLASSVKQTLLVAQIGNLEMPIYLSGPIGQLPGLSTYLGNFIGVEIREFDLLKSRPFIKIAPSVECKWFPQIMDRALALGLRPGKSQNGFDFRKDEFARKVSFKQYRHLTSKIATFTAVLLVVVGFSLWFNYNAGKEEENKLTKKIRAIFSETLPTVTRIVNPAQQLQSEIKSLRQAAGGEWIGGEYKVLDLLSEISECIPPSLQVRLTLMVVDEKGVRLKGVTDNFNTVDNIKKKLEKSSYFSSVTISSANLAPKSNEIRFEMKLQFSGT